MCSAPKPPKPVAPPPAEEPAQLSLEDTERRRKRKIGPGAETGRQALRVDLSFNPGATSGLRIPTPGA